MKKNVPSELLQIQKNNTQIAFNSLKGAHKTVERLIQRTYHNKDIETSCKLRDIRALISQLILDMDSANTYKFGSDDGDLDQFYEREHELVDVSSRLAKTMEMLTRDIDAFSIEQDLFDFEKTIKNRIKIEQIVVDNFNCKANLNLSNEDHNINCSVIDNSTFTNNFSTTTTTDTNMDHKNIEEKFTPQTLSKLNTYINCLECKYSDHQPEMTPNGDYVGSNKWIVDVSSESITGKIKDGILNIKLKLNTVWYPINDLTQIIKYVQSISSSVPKNQYLTLCLINSSWNKDITIWAREYMHPRLILLLYELDHDVIVFNQNVNCSTYFSFWHNKIDNIYSLDEIINTFLGQNEKFTVNDLSKETGLNLKSSKDLIDRLLNENRIIELGFGSSMYITNKFKI
ncbi:hypothetical protein Mzhil_1281 [Methanosalsum zhilinae DSM 4017]|uniref:Uncharacterized protein n=1 Tax=Methanosalsum zhilinae (strain DSM 4017 / NBRC 107636 / OCM 62 / WeN5) TaxID=679901 RepID=F7XN24_METZD|nr:hypothetical protein [Methanosalsum zhilinae]AEH61135.1 hypothetical protein Mzhil_1281 [Methanosalsum zhilinae DSM 4017]